MTEAEWLLCDDPISMIRHLDQPAYSRKIFLLFKLCCGRFKRFHFHDETKYVVGRFEALADALPSALDRDMLATKATAGHQRALRFHIDEAPSSLEAYIGLHAAGAVESVTAAWDPALSNEDVQDWLCTAFEDMLRGAALTKFDGSRGWPLIGPLVNDPEESAEYAGFLRELFGNPFRPVTVEPSWLTSTVVALAEGIYQERAFDRMPILADALQDAGCDNDDVLNHCRQPGEHVRGCWVVDLLTGRK